MKKINSITKYHLLFGITLSFFFVKIVHADYSPSAPDLESLGITAIQPIKFGQKMFVAFAINPLTMPETLTTVEQEIVYDVEANDVFDVDATKVSPQAWAQAYYNILVKYGDDFSDIVKDPQHAERNLYQRLKNKIQ